MRHIKKQPEPVELAQFRINGGVKYTDSNFPTEPVQKSLINDQNGLCAYCMARISRDLVKGVGEPTIIIEHYLPRNGTFARHDLEVNYSNMLGVCRGGKDNQKMGTNRELFCDQSKKNNVLKKLNPLNSNVESMIQFLDNGTIEPFNDKDEHDIQSDINLLNLNEKFTRLNRERIIRDLKNEYMRLFKQGDKSDVREYLQNELRRWRTVNADSQLQPYCLVALQFINDKLKRIGQP